MNMVGVRYIGILMINTVARAHTFRLYALLIDPMHALYGPVGVRTTIFVVTLFPFINKLFSLNIDRNCYTYTYTYVEYCNT